MSDRERLVEALHVALEHFGIGWAVDGVMDSLETGGALDYISDEAEDDE